MTQTRAPNIPLFLLLELQREGLRLLIPPSANGDSNQPSTQHSDQNVLNIAISSLLLSQTTYFCFGGSNSISSIDLSNAYNGVADYNIAAVGALLFAGNWAGAYWWCSAAVTLLIPTPTPTERLRPQSAAMTTGNSRAWVEEEREKLQADTVKVLQKLPQALNNEPASGGTSDTWLLYVSMMTIFTSSSVFAVMTSCTALRTHLFIWTVFSPKYLYAMAWTVGWHLVLNIGFGNLLWWLGTVA